LHSPTGGDTVVKVVNNAPSQIFHFTWDKLMTSLAVDPNYWLVYEVSALNHDATLDIKTLQTAAISVSPNPTSGDWTVDHLTPNSTLTLVDISGRTIWHAENPQVGVTIPAGQLVPGLYLLRVSNDKETSTLKLIKK
jgi:hypothetical protein